MLYQLARVVIDRELPVLRAHDVEMWDYVVLGRLESGPAPTQAQLAVASGRDKTRLIPILDRLQSRGLVNRIPDPRDRRNRVVTLTDAGRALLARCRAGIAAMEEDLLADLAPSARRTFLTVLEQLCASVGDAAPDSQASRKS